MMTSKPMLTLLSVLMMALTLILTLAKVLSLFLTLRILVMLPQIKILLPFLMVILSEMVMSPMWVTP